MQKEQEKFLAHTMTIREVAKLKAMMDAAGRKYKGFGKDWELVRGTLRERIENQLTVVAYAQARAIEGGRISENDFIYWKKSYGGGAPGWLQKSDPLKSVNDRQESAEANLRGFLTYHLVDPSAPPGAPGAEKRATTYVNKLIREEGAELGLEFTSEAPETEAETLLKEARKPYSSGIMSTRSKMQSVTAVRRLQLMATKKDDKKAIEALKEIGKAADEPGETAKEALRHLYKREAGRGRRGRYRCAHRLGRVCLHPWRDLPAPQSRWKAGPRGRRHGRSSA